MRTRTLAIALALTIASCNSLYVGGLKTNLVVELVDVGTVTRFPPDHVVPFQVVVRNDDIPGEVVAATKNLRVTGYLTAEDVDPDGDLDTGPDDTPPKIDAKGNLVWDVPTIPVRFTPASLVQPPGGYPVVVTPGETKLIVDVHGINGKALLPKTKVSFQAIGYVSNMWAAQGEKQLYLTIFVRRSGGGGDHDISDNVMKVPIGLP